MGGIGGTVWIGLVGGLGRTGWRGVVGEAGRKGGEGWLRRPRCRLWCLEIREISF